MSRVVRFSVSLEGELREAFDRYCHQQRFATRSEAVRQMIRDRLTLHAWESDCPDAAGTLTLVYDHHRPQLRAQLIRLQHEHNNLVISTLHAHLTRHLCLEVIVLRGPANQLRRLASQLCGLKGVHKGELVMAAAEADHEH
jgi:CopG family nickel-responsive transcriptional regulator